MAHDNGRKLVFQLTGAFAEFERTMIRQRIKAGLKRAVAPGREARPAEDRWRDRTEGAKAACERRGHLEGGEVARARDWHGPSHLKRAWLKALTAILPLSPSFLCVAPRVGGLWNPGGSPEAARKALNKDTILEMHRAFKLGGRKAIEEVMRNQPAVFLKLLVLLVPREMPVEHTGGVKAMTEDQIVDAIAAIEGYLARRSGETAKVIEGEAEVVPSLPAPARPTKAS